MLEVRRLTGSEVLARRSELAEVLIDCVEGGASVGFLAGTTEAMAQKYFEDVAVGVEEGTRVLLGAFWNGKLGGTVQSVKATFPNQPHRADIAKLLVARWLRGRGAATALMSHVEEISLREGRTLLVLDTVRDSAAERLYEHLGWQRTGVIPRYALFPDGSWCDTVVFWKHLA